MTEHDNACDKNIYEMQELRDIRNRPDILANIRFEVTPQMIMEPRYLSRPEDLRKVREMAGYVFYIETECEPPTVMLLKLSQDDVMQTVGFIEEVPQEMVAKAVSDPVLPPANGMCAVTDEIREWLKKELGI